VSIALLVGALVGRDSQTLDEFNARDAYYRARGRQAFAAGIPRDSLERYAPSDETIMMLERGYNEAAKEYKHP
jgi:hypothetical protein